MNKIKPMLPIFICLGVLVVLFVVASLVQCSNTPPEPTEPSETEATVSTEPTIAPEKLYAAAQDAISKASNLVLEYTYSQDRTVCGETFTEDRVGTASYCGYSKSQMQALIQETLTYGGYSAQYYESFISGQGYCRVNNYNYTCDVTIDEFMAMQLPAIALDASLYANITAGTDGDTTVISFQEPSSLESWITDSKYATLIAAYGTATLDADNNLVNLTYHAEYTVSAASYKLDVTIAPSTPATLDLDASQPVYPDDCVILSDLRIPRYLMRVVGDLYSAETVSARYTDSLYSAVCAEIRTQTGSFDFCGSGNDFMAKMDTQVSLTNYVGTSTVNSQSITYLDGVYSYSYNGADAVTDSNVTAETVRTDCEDAILSALLTFDAIAGAELTDAGDFVCITFTGTDEYANSLCSSICSLLGLTNLDTYAESFETEAISSYLTVNKHTGLPTAMGIYFSRSHVLSGVAYALTYQIDQAIEMPGVNAYTNITGEVPAEATVFEEATPLFYKITDANGKTMWLLGTVSMGDGRTANLPAAITDAFTAADALAVEYDAEAFAQALLTDPTLQSQISKAYYYSDNSTTASHMSEELYAKVYPLLLATGSNSINAPYMKVIIWENLIESLYLQQSYSLTMAQSMDQRLLDWAYAQEKKIYEIESYISVLNILSGYSDDLQTALLEELLQDGLITYAADANQIYELWCAGDADGLLAVTATDTSEMTEEQLTLYNEYYKATYTNRLKAMLTAAKNYLGGEETVFYAVNIEYLLGDEGLVTQLEAAGYTVEAVSHE